MIFQFAPNLACLCLETRKIEVRTPKNCLSSSLGEGGSCNSETKHDRRTAPGSVIFFDEEITGNYRNKGHNNEKLSWVRVLVNMVSVSWKLCTIEKQRQA
jgi:hypothetical protein